MSAAVLWPARWNKEAHTFSQFASIARLLKDYVQHWVISTHD